jgi:hypothetical protein
MRTHETPSRPTLVAGLILATVLATAGVLVVSRVADASSASKPHARSAGRHKVRVHAASAGGFAILERATAASDRANGAIVALSEHAAGLEPAGARRLTSDSAGTLWLVPAGDELCLVDVTGPNAQGITSVMTCDDRVRAEARGLLGVSIDGLYGAAPDGVARVTLRGADGTAEVMTPADNAFRGPTPTSVASVEIAGPAGVKSFLLGA